jgi:MFS family permease
MDNIPNKNEIVSTLYKVVPPLILSIMAKIASDYKRGKRVSVLSSLITTILAACGSVLGYWLTQYLGWKEYKMVMTIFFFGLFSEKLFEFLFSKYFINALLNIAQDALVESMSNIVKRFKK